MIEQREGEGNRMPIPPQVGTGTGLIKNNWSLNLLLEVKGCRFEIAGDKSNPSLFEGLEKRVLPGGVFMNDGKARIRHGIAVSLSQRR